MNSTDTIASNAITGVAGMVSVSAPSLAESETKGGISHSPGNAVGDGFKC